MHTGLISFCDRINYNIKSSDTKDDILTELGVRFNIQILQKHWHRLDEHSVLYLQRVPHLACLRTNGNPYYMYFTRYEDVPIIYFIDKKVHPGHQRPRIILAKGMWSDVIFDGTLLDGEMVRCHDSSWTYLINDMIGYKGEFLWNKTLPQRIECSIDLLKNHHTYDKLMDTCAYQIKRFANATQEGTAALIEFSKSLNYTSRGIYFYPFSCKYKPKLINFDDTLIKSVNRKVKDIPDFKEKDSLSAQVSPIIPSSPQHDKDSSSLIRWLRKTELPDVYDVYTTNHGMVNNTKEGIAYVPSMSVSKMLRSIFKDTTVAIYIPFNCRIIDSTKILPLSQVVE